MVECAHRKPGSLGQFTHLQGLKLHGDSSGRRPRKKWLRRHGTASRYVRVKSKVAKKVDSRREAWCRERTVQSRSPEPPNVEFTCRARGPRLSSEGPGCAPGHVQRRVRPGAA